VPAYLEAVLGQRIRGELCRLIWRQFWANNVAVVDAFAYEY